MKTKTCTYEVRPEDLSPAAAGFRFLLEVILGQKVTVRKIRKPEKRK